MSVTATPPEPEEEEESLLHWQTAASLRGDVHWDEQSPDGEESEEGLGVTEGGDVVKLCGNSGPLL